MIYKNEKLCIITLAEISHKSQNAGFGENTTALRKNVNSCHHRDKAHSVNDPWEVRDEPEWERPVVLMSACSESWKMTEHLNSRLELNKCNIPESEKGETEKPSKRRSGLKHPQNRSCILQQGSWQMLDMVKKCCCTKIQNGIPHWIYERPEFNKELLQLSSHFTSTFSSTKQ